MKRAWVLFLAMVMLVTLMPGLQAAFAEGAAPTVVTIGSASPFEEGWLDQNVMQILKKDLNIEIEYNYYDADKMSLMLASNDLPDIVIGTQETLPTVLQNKLALNLDTVLDQAPNLDLPIYKARNELVRTLMGGEEKGLYVLAPGMGPERVGAGKIPGRGYTIRWDWYKEIGCPPINNDEDYLNAIKAIAALHPTTEDGQTVYGIGTYNILNQFFVRGAYTKDVAVNPWTFNGYLFSAGVDDGILYDGYMSETRSAFWKDMRFFNALNREGLFDLDSFTMTMDEWTAKIKSGVYIADLYTSQTLYNDMVQKDAETLAGFVVVPSEGAVVHANKLNITGNAPTNFMFIPANSENWKAALSVFNYISNPDYIRTIYSGVKGEQWDYDANNVPKFFDETIVARAANGEAWQKTGFGRGCVAWWNLAQPTAYHPDGYSYDLMEEPENRALGLSKLHQDYDAYYKVVYPGQALVDLVTAGKTIDLSKDFAQTVSVGVNYIPLDIKRIMDACNDIVYRAMPKLVMAEGDEEFAAVQQKVFQDLKDAGEEQAWAWCNENFNKVRDQVKPVFDQARELYVEMYLNK